MIPAELKEKLKLSVVPRFLIYQGGKVRTEINGVRYNDIEDAIGEFIPEDPDDKWAKEAVYTLYELIEYKFKNLGTVNILVRKFKKTINLFL